MSLQSFPIQLTPELAEMLERRMELYGGQDGKVDSKEWLIETENLNRKIAIFTEIAYGAAKAQGLLQ